MHSWLPLPLHAGSLRPWLVARGSLSERIRARCPAFRVLRLHQARSRAFPDELAALGLPAGARPLVREVLLYCGDMPMVFARSLAGADHLDGPWRALRGLGSRPLASMLFADPRIARGALQFCRLDARAPLYRRAVLARAGLAAAPWARRSLFRREGAPLLVSEVFLPGIATL